MHVVCINACCMSAFQFFLEEKISRRVCYIYKKTALLILTMPPLPTDVVQL